MTRSDALHLTEEERQCAADGSLRAERGAPVLAHLEGCHECAADVERLTMLMTQTQQMQHLPQRDGAIGELWPEIEARIERSKVVAFESPMPAPVAHRSRSTAWIFSGVAAAAILVAIALPHLVGRGDRGTNPRLGTSVTQPALIPASDSSIADEQEANTLLNELEMQRSMLRPQAAASVDRDLRTIDKAIAEVKSALANDPNNPTLRRLLASSLRQKVELLKRANNAG